MNKIYKITHKNKVGQKGGKINKKYIVVDGVSSSGKTTICKFYEKNGYKCLSGDDYMHKTHHIVMDKLPNEFLPYVEFRKKHNILLGELIYEDAKKQKTMIDVVSQHCIEFFKKNGERNDVFIIVLYTTLDDLVRNIESRRHKDDPRDKIVFKQYGEKFIKTTSNDIRKLDTINLPHFIDLLHNMKYLFVDEQDLIKFATKIFEDMEIKNNEDTPIKLRNEFEYDYILKTKGKTKEDIMEELEKINT